jgi:hypothetical protein
MPATPDFLEAGRAFIEAEFPECRAAFLAGSVVRGEATATSDLDIVVITDREDAPYRESFLWDGWPVEAFVHNERSILDFFESDARRYRPSLQQMCAEGLVLRDIDGVGARTKEEARRQLDAGPEPLTPEELDRLRYTVTDLLDDFSGSVREEETYLIAHGLAEASVRLLLLGNGRWLGGGKWMLRALRAFDPVMANQLGGALKAFYKSEEKAGLVAFAEVVLERMGGRLFEGFRSPRKDK